MTPSPPGFFATVALLLRLSQRRERARMKATAKRSSLGAQGVFALTVGSLVLMQFMLGSIYIWHTGTAARMLDEHGGRLAVHEAFYENVVRPALDEPSRTRIDAVDKGRPDIRYDREASALQKSHGGDRDHWRAELERRVREAPETLVVDRGRLDYVADGAPFLTVLLVLWWLSLALQGEGLGFDVARRRHPMWEWMLRFPVSPAAVFTAEALAPLAANPILLTAPVLFAVVAGGVSGSAWAGFAALPVALPLVASATVWSKAIEALVLLRSPPRNRGVWLAVFAGIGFAALFLPVALFIAPRVGSIVLQAAWPWLSTLPAPGLLLSTGTPGGWCIAMAASLVVGTLLTLPALGLMRVAMARGIEGGFGDDSAVSSDGGFATRRTGWFADPLRRKDWLWLMRDRGALFQLVAVPLGLAALQLFQLRRLLEHAETSWNHFAGVVVGLGAYMLFIAGPRALASEGPALVLTLSWPRSLEDMLRAKVQLLMLLVSAMVYLSLAVILWMFPADWPGLVLVAAAWPLFGLAVAEKAVTLVQAPNQSGVVERPPQARVFLAGLGNLAFAVGVFNAQWNVAVAAIVLNWVFAGALWQSFRFRLAYLFDPDSEPRVQPPTVVSATVAIVGLMELGVVVMVPLLLIFGKEGAFVAQAIGYGVAAVVVSVVVVVWHVRQGVYVADIVTLDGRAARMPAAWCLAAAATGAALALVAFGYRELLWTLPLPALHESLEKSARLLVEWPNARTAVAVLAVGFAPWVEEFLFRGLLFRAMLAQWRLPQAVIASSAFFAILHPPPFWPMIFLLGAASALVYWRSRALLPCIVLHLVYNALVVVMQ